MGWGGGMGKGKGGMGWGRVWLGTFGPTMNAFR